MKPLESAALKADWAHHHLNALYAEVERVLGPKKQRALCEFDPKKALYIFRREYRKSQRDWDKWSLMVGDVAVNLRSALDHIAYELALQTTEVPNILERTHFPIMKERNDPDFRGRTRHFKPDAVKVIERFQPYATLDRWPIPHNQPLFVINELARIDKHRTVNVIVDTCAFTLGGAPFSGNGTIRLVTNPSLYKSAWVYALRKDARESWDHFISDEILRVVEIPKAVMDKSSGFVQQLKMWLNGELWFELFLRVRHLGNYCDYASLIEPYIS